MTARSRPAAAAQGGQPPPAATVETSTSETPSLPTLNVTTDAGARANDAELKPVTDAVAHLAGLTCTPFMVCLLVCTSGSVP